MRRNIFLFSAILWVSTFFSFAQSASYYLVLGAVPPLSPLTNGSFSLAGHAFIGYGLQREMGGDSVIRFLGFGRDMGEKIKVKQFLTSLSIAGSISSGDSIYAYSQNAKIIRMKISEAQLQKVLEIEQKWIKMGKYQFISSDCVTFADEIAAKVLNLHLPKRNLFRNPLPHQYVKRLNTINSPKIAYLSGGELFEMHKNSLTNVMATK
ncbi:MAG: hypothetical protein ACKVTZ_11500 [Bacteroidia bacterium]